MGRKKGVLTVSLEVELAWGMKEAEDYSCFSRGRKKETRTLRRILDLCDKLDIPVTFDFVGHLLLERCDGDHNHGHPEGWFAEDPATDKEEDPLWYAPDMVDMVIDAEIDHEIATHTFSHIWVDEVEPEVLEFELDKVKKLHEKFELREPSSIVTPQNRRPISYESLKKNGMKIIRKCPEENRTKGKVKMLWNDLFSESPRREPEIEKDILETYGSCRASLTGNYLPHGQNPPHIFYRALPVSKDHWIERHKKRLRKEVDRVIEEETNLHLWSHLWEMSNPSQMDIFEDFIKSVGEKKKQEELEVKTMRSLWEDH